MCSPLLSGQDYFKQSNTRLHFIADRATVMSLELYGEPWHMIDEISALGLRHVGYGIPTDTLATDQMVCMASTNGGLQRKIWRYPKV